MRKQDNYVKEVRSWGHQLRTATCTSEPTVPVKLNIFVNMDILESRIVLGFIENIAEYDKLPDSTVRMLLHERAKEANDVETLDMLDMHVKAELRTKMKTSSVKERMVW